MAVVVSPTAAQSGALTGVVADETGAVLPGATVTLSGGPAGSRETQTDAAGRFTFPGLAPGAYRLTVFLSGFGEVTVDRVSVAADPVELPPITLRLASFDEAVVVTATRIEEPLQQVPMSISAVTGADIERRAIGNLTELSRWTPGLTVVDQGARSTFGEISRASATGWTMRRTSTSPGPRDTGSAAATTSGSAVTRRSPCSATPTRAMTRPRRAASTRTRR